MQDVFLRDLGMVDYNSAWNYQELLLQKNVLIKSIAGKDTTGLTASEIATVNYLLLLEHPPVVTMGKSGFSRNILLTEEDLMAKGISVIKTNRGGDVTFHGPEQLVGYPILDLEKFYTDIGRYLRDLEQVVINTLAEYGLKGERSPGETGVWLEPAITGKARKICAMGVRCSRWVTMHGFALNVNTNLDYFNFIIPCGIADKKVTSLEKELNRYIPIQEVKAKLAGNFEKVFNVRLYQEKQHL